jgi:hypothetical protein
VKALGTETKLLHRDQMEFKFTVGSFPNLLRTLVLCLFLGSESRSKPIKVVPLPPHGSGLDLCLTYFGVLTSLCCVTLVQKVT